MKENVGVDKNKNRVFNILKTGTRVSNWVVISVGGSLIVPNEINTIFISNFKEVILKQISYGRRFIIVCGGGKTARDYQNAYKMTVSIANNDTMDWIGINATKLNAHFMANIFESVSDQDIVDNPNEKIVSKKSIVVACGWKPGFSTDCATVLIAKNVGAQKIINLTNADGVYNKDPNVKNGKKAKMFKSISWDNFLTLIPKEWTPGLSSPFDPIASMEAKKNGLEVAIINGKKLVNMELYLEGLSFVGTTIKN